MMIIRNQQRFHPIENCNVGQEGNVEKEEDAFLAGIVVVVLAGEFRNVNNISSTFPSCFVSFVQELFRTCLLICLSERRMLTLLLLLLLSLLPLYFTLDVERRNFAGERNTSFACKNTKERRKYTTHKLSVMSDMVRS
jgi:hypothetical protein